MKRILVGLVMILASSMLFAEKLSDKKIMQVRANYEFIDSCDCIIPETCGIEYNDVFVLLDSESDTITVYSTDSDCTISAKSCVRLVCTDFYGGEYTIYKL